VFRHSCRVTMRFRRAIAREVGWSGTCTAGHAPLISSAALSHAGAPGRRHPLALEPDLDAQVSEARATWSGVFAVDASRFRAYIAARLPRDATPAALEGLRVADLYLACACIERNAAALAVFEDQYMGEAVGAFRKLRFQPAAVDDLCQVVREKVLIGDRGRAPRLTEYSGRGGLAAWMRIVARRIGLNTIRLSRPERSWQEVDCFAGARHPELACEQQRYEYAVRLALQQAIDALSADQRLLVRQRFIESLPAEEIAALHGQHRATISRRLNRILHFLRIHTCCLLERELGCQPSAVDSIVDVVLDQTR
jgi:RNA polymerase sigma-70 factor (ECF subfamily)